MPARPRQGFLPGLSDDEPAAPADAAAVSTSGASVGPAAAADEGMANGADEPPPFDVPEEAPALSGTDAAAGEALRVWIVDAFSLIYQVFHAIPQMTSPRGEPVNAVYGFTRDVLRILKQKQPTHLFVAFDPPGDTFRHELYESYKAQRAETPDELRPQFPHIRRVLETLGVPLLERSGFEADDVLATVARATAERGGTCYLVTADKDCRQLIRETVFVYNMRKDQALDAAALAADWGVRPEQVVDYQALVGDSVDNVPGVPQIGPKAAQELLAQFGTLEGIYEHLDQVRGAKRKQNLAEHREQAILSRRLVRLDDQVPLDIPWGAGEVGRFNRQAFAALLGEFGFRSFAAEFDQLPQQAPLPRKTWDADYRLVQTREQLDALCRDLAGVRRLSVDTETTGLDPLRADLVGLSLAWRPGLAYYVPVRCPSDESCLSQAEVLAALRPILEDPAVAKLGQNLKYDLLVLWRAGVRLAGLACDTMVASYLLEAGTRSHGLDELAARFLDYTTTKITELIGSGKQQKRMDDVPLAQITHYAAEDADVALRLADLLEPKLAPAGLDALFSDLEMPLIEILAEMERTGIRVDAARLGELSAEYETRLRTLEQEIYRLAGHPFNIDSPKQLQQVLFEELKLPVQKKTQTGASTDAAVLEILARLHPLPAQILEYRHFAKLKGTYIDALPTLVNPETGRVHCSFNQVVAATGRLSSSDPNLQNIPVRNERGREIRAAFLPGPEGWRLLAADYSQIELRFLAHLSEDEALCAAFARDEDIHAQVASQVFGVPLAEVTGEMRRKAKAVNFGVVYGQSAYGLASALDIGQEEAQAFIDAYFAKYPGVDRFLSSILAECAENGYVKTILGRRREIRGVRRESGRQRSLPERTAINTVIQGSAADLIKQAMVAVHRRLKQSGLQAQMLLQIHDELIFEAPPPELEPLAVLVRDAMTSVMCLKAPLKVDVKVGANWADLEKQ